MKKFTVPQIQFPSKIYQPINILSSLMVAVLAIVLYQIAVKGLAVRYIADDYCTAASALNMGWWNAQGYWYNGWSGRFSFTATVTGLELLGTWIVSLLPLLTIIIWIPGSVWLFRSLANLVNVRLGILPALAMAMVTLCAYIQSNTDQGQTFFWFTGNITYTLPLVVMTYVGSLMAVLWRQASDDQGSLSQFFVRRQVVVSVAIITLATFYSAGLNETQAIFQLVLFGLALVACTIFLFSQYRVTALKTGIVSLAGLVASGLSLWLVAQAPGNQIRASAYPPHPTIEDTIVQSMSAIIEFLVKDWYYAWFIYVGLVVAGLASIYIGRQGKMLPKFSSQLILSSLTNILFASVIAFFLCCILFFPSYYMQGYPTAMRTLAGISLIMSLLAIVWGYQLARLMCGLVYQLKGARPVYLAAIATLVIVTFQLASAQAMPVIHGLDANQIKRQEFAQKWDEQHHHLQQLDNQTQAVHINKLGRTYGLEDITNDPDHWINLCVADYYGLNQVIAE